MSAPLTPRDVFVPAPMTPLGTAKVILLLPLVLVRAVLGLGVLFLAFLVIMTLTVGAAPGQPFSPLRRKLIRAVCKAVSRFELVVLGYWCGAALTATTACG